MGWTIEFERAARKELRKLAPPVRDRILDFIVNKIPALEHPRKRGRPMKGRMSGLWRYKEGDYRIICRIEDHNLVVVIVTIGHRRDVYR